MPATAIDAVDPQLVRGAGGLLRPRSGSPAVDGAVGDDPAVMVDMDGQPRSGPKDRGADELSSAPVVAAPLTADSILSLIRGPR
jgi:hypothetical protein